MKLLVTSVLLLGLATTSHIAHACSGTAWVKCGDDCNLRTDNDPATLAAALAAAQSVDACLSADVIIYRVTQSGGGVTEIDHWFSVNSYPPTSTSNMTDEGFTVDHDQIPIPPQTPSGTQWGLAELVFSNWEISFPCSFPCF